ncbi:hypothetical protein [Aquiflexum sp.]|uniref:hypothetical protein n=1 Tax=Aquiflexum sp. TaxID=1872584 RepID=UPI00359358B1
MKKQLILITCAIFLLNSCDNDKEMVLDIGVPNGVISALKNGQTWNTNEAYFSHSEFSEWQENNDLLPQSFILSGGSHDNEQIVREGFSIRFILPSWSQQNISDSFDFDAARSNDISKLMSLFYTMVDDGDVLGTIYGTDTSAIDNYIQLVRYDKKRKEIHGIFQVTLFMIEGSILEPNAPEKLQFTSGKFSAKIPEKWIIGFDD